MFSPPTPGHAFCWDRGAANTGVIIVKNTPGAVRFLEEWALGARPGGVCEYAVNHLDHREQARRDTHACDVCDACV